MELFVAEVGEDVPVEVGKIRQDVRVPLSWWSKPSIVGACVVVMFIKGWVEEQLPGHHGRVSDASSAYGPPF